MVKDPAARFPDGDALLRAVDDVLSGSAPSAVPAAAGVSGASAFGAAGPTGTAVMPLPVLPDDEPEDDAHVSTPPPARPRPTALIVGALVALALIAALVVGIDLLTAGDGETSTAAPTTSVEQTTAAEQTPAVLVLDPAAYVGRPVADVQAELAAMDLTVVLQPVQTADVAEGLVTGLTPTDELVAGATVTVSHAVAPPAPPPAPAEDQADEGDGERQRERQRQRERERQRQRERERRQEEPDGD